MFVLKVNILMLALLSVFCGRLYSEELSSDVRYKEFTEFRYKDLIFSYPSFWSEPEVNKKNERAINIEIKENNYFSIYFLSKIETNPKSIADIYDYLATKEAVYSGGKDKVLFRSLLRVSRYKGLFSITESVFPDIYWSTGCIEKKVDPMIFYLCLYRVDDGEQPKKIVSGKEYLEVIANSIRIEPDVH